MRTELDKIMKVNFKKLILKEKEEFSNKYIESNAKFQKSCEEIIIYKEELEKLKKVKKKIIFQEKDQNNKIKKLNLELNEELFKTKNSLKSNMNVFKADLDEIKSNFLSENQELIQVINYFIKSD